MENKKNRVKKVVKDNKEYLIVTNLSQAMIIKSSDIKKNSNSGFSKLINCRKGEHVVFFSLVEPGDLVCLHFSNDKILPVVEQVGRIPVCRPGGNGWTIARLSFTTGEVVGVRVWRWADSF